MNWTLVYVIFSIGVFLYCMHTAFEDVTLMRQAYGEPDYPYPHVAFMAGVLIVSFIPFLNVLLVGFTMFYRRGHM